jgi:aspartate kinase
MIIMKFGGGCLRDGKSYARAAGIIKAHGGWRTIVVSASQGVTDRLVQAIRDGAAGKGTEEQTLSSIREIHRNLADGSIADGEIRAGTSRVLEEKIGRLARLIRAVSLAGEASPSLQAHILSYGERLSAVIFSGALRSAGVPSAAWDSDEIGMVTDETSENATVNLDEFRKNVISRAHLLFRANAVPVITGFFGRTPEGRVSTFGRNGSDYSAAVVAAALDASRLEIWKDVDGFMSADPDLVDRPVHVPRLSWLEAAELSYFGARILHPRTFEPLGSDKTAVIIKSFLDPDKPGTEILARGFETDSVVKSVTCNSRIALLSIYGPGVGIKPGVIGKIGRRLSDRGINIHSVITSQTRINLLVDKEDAGRSLEEIRGMSNGIIQRAELKKDIALIAVVGEGLLRRPGIAARIFSAVSGKGINVEMISTGASEVAAYFIIGKDHTAEAVNAVHDEFFGNEFGAAIPSCQG